jgi:hypothetical protein
VDVTFGSEIGDVTIPREQAVELAQAARLAVVELLRKREAMLRDELALLDAALAASASRSKEQGSTGEGQ